jgi:TolA-binding protein
LQWCQVQGNKVHHLLRVASTTPLPFNPPYELTLFLPQGAKVAFAGDAENKAGGQAKLDIRALDDHDDLEAEVRHYRNRVEDLQGTVDQLRDELQAQRSARELQQANAEMDAVRRDLTDNASSERRPRDTSEQATESRSALVAQLKEFEEANR